MYLGRGDIHVFPLDGHKAVSVLLQLFIDMILKDYP